MAVHENEEEGKILNLKIDTNRAGVFLRLCRCLLELKKFHRGFHPEHCLNHLVCFVLFGR